MQSDGAAFGLLRRILGPREAIPIDQTTEERPEPPRAAATRSVQEILAGRILAAHLDRRGGQMGSDLSSLSGLPAGTVGLLLRAMLAAGHADGGLDELEARRIRAALSTAELDPEARSAFESRLDEPPSLEPLLREVEDDDTAARVYAVSVRVVRRGHATNCSYLDYLAHRLKLPRDLVVRLNRRWDVPV